MISCLKCLGYKYKWIVNITDIGHLNSLSEDKIINSAKALNTSVELIVEKFTSLFIQDLKSINVIMPQQFIKASSVIDVQIYMIKKMLMHKYAYYKEDGIYINVSKIIKKHKIKYLLNKHLLLNDAGNFALWRFTKEINAINTELGIGIPGWHIECLAIIYSYLDINAIDIHIGGEDHIFTHHNNEIIQKMAFDRKNILSKLWFHTGFVNFNGVKMSKTANNIILLQDIINENIYPDALKLFYCIHNIFYKSINFSWADLKYYNKEFIKIFNIILKQINYFNIFNIFKNRNAFNSFVHPHSKYYTKFIFNKIKMNFFNKNILTIIISYLESCNIKKFKTGLLILNNLFTIDLYTYLSNNFDLHIIELIQKRSEYKEKALWKDADAIRNNLQKHYYLITIDINEQTFVLKLPSCFK